MFRPSSRTLERIRFGSVETKSTIVALTDMLRNVPATEWYHSNQYMQLPAKYRYTNCGNNEREGIKAVNHSNGQVIQVQKTAEGEILIKDIRRYADFRLQILKSLLPFISQTLSAYKINNQCIDKTGMEIRRYKEIILTQDPCALQRLNSIENAF